MAVSSYKQPVKRFDGELKREMSMESDETRDSVAVILLGPRLSPTRTLANVLPLTKSPETASSG